MEMIMRERTFKKGDVLYSNGNEPEHGYMVARGSLEIYDCPEAINEEVLGSGSFICEFPSFLNEQPLTMNLRAIEDTEVFEISKKEICHFMRNYPGLMMLVSNSKYIQ